MSFKISDSSEPMGEVVDAKNRPFCILPAREILRQKLWHRAVGILLRATENRWLLRRNAESAYDFTFWSILPPGATAEDFCASLREYGRIRRFLGLFPPCAANRYSFAAIFETSSPRPPDDENILAVDAAGLKAILKIGYQAAPFLLRVIFPEDYPEKSDSQYRADALNLIPS